jgi:hypothetical protein
MRNLILYGIFGLLLTSCYFADEDQSTKHLTKDFNLCWWGEKKSSSIYINKNQNEYGGGTVVEETVYEIGYDDNFIIAKQYPNKEKEINSRLFSIQDSISKDFLIANLSDTIYLSKDDSVYTKNGNWYHISNGWNPSDSLYPYKKITNYHIIDIRNYNSDNQNGFERYSFDNQKDFELKKVELNIPKNLKFKALNIQ